MYCRHYLRGSDMGLRDYDGRTALHLAASEGHEQALTFLLETCKVPPSPTDRYLPAPNYTVSTRINLSGNTLTTNVVTVDQHTSSRSVGHRPIYDLELA